jgi:hypothetical protein
MHQGDHRDGATLSALRLRLAVVCLAFFAFLSASIHLPASSFRARVSVAAAFVAREASVELARGPGLARLEASRPSRIDGGLGNATVADRNASIAKAPVHRPDAERAIGACWTPRPKTQAELMVFLI